MSQSTKFLATTALEEFWDTSQPLIFTGPWCKRFDRQKFWGELQHETLPCNWPNSEERRTAYELVKQKKFAVAAELGQSLNKLHGTSYSSRFWLILLGPWLHWYLSVLFDHYVAVQKALELYPALSTIALSPSSFVVPGNTNDYAMLAYLDSYQLQLYSRVFDFMGLECEKKDHKVVPEKIDDGRPRNSVLPGVIDRFLRWGAGEAQMVSRSPYFPRAFEGQLCARLGGRMWPSIHPICNPERGMPDSVKRSQLKLDLDNNKFSQLVATTLPLDVPTCFVELFTTTMKQARHHYPRRPASIFSANSWYYDEEFKFWAAEAADLGTMLIGTQHGANYGAQRMMPSEEHERSIVDRYYSWGWTGDGVGAIIVPQPANKLVALSHLKADNAKSSVLWAATSESRYLREIAYGPEAFEEYLEWQARFLRALKPELRGKIRFRPHHADLGWSVADRLLQIDPSLSIESWATPFASSLANSRIYICDHCSTTFGEALAASQPTILFWNPAHNELRPEAEEWFDLLRRSEILFDSAESAAEKLEAVYDDVATWWEHPSRQKARTFFCNRFARTSPTAARDWAAELRNLCKTNKTALTNESAKFLNAN